MYNRIVADIANYSIRGGEEVARFGLLAFSLKKKELDEKCSFISTYIKLLQKAKEEIINARIEDGSLYEILNQVFSKETFNKAQTLDEIKITIQHSLDKYTKVLEKLPIQIASIGTKKIKHKTTILTHGHSSYVESIIDEARKVKKFDLTLTDTILPPDTYLHDLKKKNIKFKVSPFAEIASLLEHTDLILLGCSAIDKKKRFYMQTGALALCLLAKQLNTSVYVCTSTFKKSKKDSFEISPLPYISTWSKLQKGIPFQGQELERVDAKLLTGVICEHGVLSCKEFFSK